jgi:hypothetical protein
MILSGVSQLGQYTETSGFWGKNGTFFELPWRMDGVF